MSSSGITEAVLARCSSTSSMATAYFYFDFRDPDKQAFSKLVKSLVVQFSFQLGAMPTTLKSAYSDSHEGTQQPSIETMLGIIQESLRGFAHSYMILDALDECSDLEDLLEFFEIVPQWDNPRLHILVTSRRVKDIEESIESLTTKQISIEGALVNQDVHKFIQERLRKDPKLKKWPEKTRMEIEEALMSRADGMCVMLSLRVSFADPPLGFDGWSVNLIR